MRPSTPWIVVPAPDPDRPRKCRLFCFPHAGGAAVSYHPWGAALPELEVCALQLPGRASRISEPPIQAMKVLVPRICQEIRDLLVEPYLFFGHSMGALIAFEVARELRRLRWKLPAGLLLSGRRSPYLEREEWNLHQLTDEAFVARISQVYGGMPRAILDEPELLRMSLIALRADFLLLETHTCPEEPPLDCPITVMGGTEDQITPVRDLEGWKAVTTGAFRLHLMRGGHFFLHEDRKAFLQRLSQEVAAMAP